MRYNINTSVVCLLAIVVCFIVTTTTSQSQSADLVEDRRISERPVQVHRRKRNLGEVILSAIPIIGGIFRNRKAAEAAARRHDESMRMQLHQLCTAICVSEWSAWGACSQPCGGGTSERTRTSQTIGMCADLQNFECPHSLRQTAPCNPDCAHGGLVEGPGQCQCTPSWTGQCCQQEVRCPYPGRPEHGEVSGTWPARYQTVASFTCHTGYVLEGNSDSECLTSGQWSRPKPVCHRTVCSAMQAQPHVVLLNPADHYFVGDELIYICDEGYSMQTPENSRECRPGEGTQGRWSGIEPRCIPVSCGDPGFPVNGARTGEGFLFGNTWQYTCNEGYTLIGSPELTCMATGYWLGASPSCEQIMCEEPYEPENGAMRLRNPEYGAVASFTCHEGYRLEGPSEIECMTDGEWSNPEPVCEAAMCVDPVVPQNGAKDGGLFYFPHSVTYHCFNGYVLQGVDVLQCTASGAWSGVAPSCEPCSSGTYMEESSPGVCQQCPLNSHTTTDASTSREQCVCDEGYAGPPGGPCEEILCSVLTDPAHGYLSESCGNIVNSSCHFACEDGFIISRGSGVRTCQNSGLWDGQETICTACGRHTYKNSEQSCLPCPQHSHTQGEASMRADCQCDDGYESSVEGLCSDVNECLENDGKGPCNDICENRDGGFQCACSIQGHAIKPEDPYNCVIERQCRNLTEAEAPENGGLLCHWYLQENSQQCSIRCNSGYEFPTRTNDYETCGPSTSYVWTFRTVDRTAQLEPCLEEFFPDFQLEASSLYFVSACQDMTDEEKEDVYLEFARRLEAKGLCQKNAQRVCDISHMAVICGNVTTHSGDRKRRDASQPADLGFGVKALKREERTKDCSQICIFLRIPSRFCNQLCAPTYKRFLKASVLYARRQLQNIYRNSTALRELAFSAAHRQFNPAPRGLRTSEVEGLCPNGMGIANDNCIMCKPGTFLSVNSRRCEICPVGTYQPLEGHSACVPCPPGTNSNAPGSSFCTVCPPSHYGDRCTHTCQCVHGTCDPRDGTCSCDNGWTGPTCDTDVDGCHEDSCLGATTCLDIPAPGSGFQCVSA